jgi:hypothetical protein
VYRPLKIYTVSQTAPADDDDDNAGETPAAAGNS